MKQNNIRAAVISTLVIGASTCPAKPPFLKVFLSTYLVKPTTELGKARCRICHEPAGPPDLNLYGKAVQTALASAHARMVTPEILKSIEKLDSNHDGVSNINEIKRGSLPGKPNPKPQKKPRHAGESTPSSVVLFLISVQAVPAPPPSGVSQ